MDMNIKDGGTNGSYSQGIPLQPRFSSINNDFILTAVRPPTKCDDVNVVSY